MTIEINKISIESNELNIEYKGEETKIDKVIMSYYGQWNGYIGKFPIPSYAGAKNDIYDKITHLAYGFMGFNENGDIGTWDFGADLGYYPAPQGQNAYSTDFYKYLDVITEAPQSFSKSSNGYKVGSPLNTHKFPTDSITGNIQEAPQFYRLAYVKYLKPDLKIIISFGGWEYGNALNDSKWQDSTSPSEVFYNITQYTEKLSKFVNNITDLIKNYKFQMIEFNNEYYPIPYTTPNGNLNSPTVHDEVINGKLADGYKRVGQPFNLFSGVDIDWEYPYGCDQCAKCTGTSIISKCPGGWKPNDEELQKSYNGYSNLLSKLKTNLPSPYFVSTTTAGNPSDITKLVNQSNIVDSFKTIDRISIMSYDFMNGNNYITHDSPLYNQKIKTDNGIIEWNTDSAVTNMLTKIDSNKINIGIPNYGRFQYIKNTTLQKLGYTDNNSITKEITDQIFNGSTEGLFTACAQSNPSTITCPWVTGNIEINSINYDITPTTAVVPNTLCGGNCNFNDNSVKSEFTKIDDTNVGVTYYISNNTYTNSDIFNGEESRIILSMPSEYSIQEKTNYIKKKKSRRHNYMDDWK